MRQQRHWESFLNLLLRSLSVSSTDLIASRSLLVSIIASVIVHEQAHGIDGDVEKPAIDVAIVFTTGLAGFNVES
jgi:hypothetical protein